MSENKNRIEWIDGLRGLLTIWIMCFHYSIAFINKGFVGFASNYPQEEFLNIYISNLPFSIFINSSFPLYLLMVLIGFIPAYKYFKDHKEESIIRQAKKRYLRFMIPTFLSFTVCFIIYHAGLLLHFKAGEVMNVKWLQSIMIVDHSFLNLLYEGLILAYVKGSQYVSTSWINGHLFIGSFISYSILLLFGKMKNRIPVYIALFIFFFVYDQMYICFIMGIIAADIVSSKELNNSKTTNIFVYILIAIFGLAIGLTPDFLVPKPLQVSTLAAIGSCMIIVGISQVKAIQHLLENKVLFAVSKCSFSAILIHVLILSSVSCGQYLIMLNMGIAKEIIVPIVLVTAIPVQIIAIFLFHKLVEAVNRFVNQIMLKIENSY